jgi:hypothetical protein
LELQREPKSQSLRLGLTASAKPRQTRDAQFFTAW